MRERWGRSRSATRVRWIVRRNALCCRGATNIGVERVLLLLLRRRRRRRWWCSPRHACLNRSPRRGVAVAAGVAMRAAANRYSPTAASQVRRVRAIVVMRLMRVVRKRRRRRGDSGGGGRHIVFTQQLSNANRLQFSSQRRHEVGGKTRGKRR